MTASLDDVRRRRNSNNGTRVPPHDATAEEAVLGAMLLDRDAIGAAVDIVTADDFYKPANSHIYDAIIALYGHGQPCDAVTVADQLRRAGLLESIGGAAALTALITSTPSTRSAGRYAAIVAAHAQLRRLIGAAGDIAELGYSTPDDIPAVIDRAEQLVYNIADRARTSHAVHLGDSLGTFLDRLEALYDTGGAIQGVPTGFIDLDERLGGLRPGQLIVVAGRPGMGKSVFLGNIIAHAAGETGAGTLLVSAEMALEEIQDRFAASEARVDLTRIRNGRLIESDWPKLAHALGRFAEMPIWVHEAPAATLLSIRAEARRVAAKTDLKLIVVDYLQLLKGVGRFENRQSEVASLARGLKELALDLRIPVIAAAQLNRALEIRSEKRPGLADLRESGELENSSDVVMFLYRDDYYNPSSEDRGTCEVHVAKHRNGPLGVTHLAWLDHYGRFADMVRP